MLKASLILLCSLMMSAFSIADTYPSRPVKMITGYPPGAATDLYGRAISKQLSESMGQPFVFENRVGAAGTVAAEALVRSTPDGYLILNTASQIVINPFVQKLSFNTEKDLIPVAQTIAVSYVLLTGPNFPASNLVEFVDHVKKNPKKLNYGSYGNGSGPHLAMAMLQKAAGFEVQHIQYRGSAQVLTALMAGEIDMAFDTTTTTLELIKAGKLKPIAIGGPKSAELLPSVPPIAQTYPGFNCDGWQGVFVPAGTPKEIVKKLFEEMNKIRLSAEFRALTSSRGVTVVNTTQEQFADYFKSELKKYEKVVKENNIYLD
ncbi:MAG: tripartite tricarboxylate transporter substrate binding protein [Betaproteobacteria bacterium]